MRVAWSPLPFALFAMDAWTVEFQVCGPVKVGIRCALQDATGSRSLCHDSWSVKAWNVFRGQTSALEICLCVSGMTNVVCT